MNNPYAESMGKRSTEELKQLIANSQKYTPEAVEAAIAVLDARNEVFTRPVESSKPTNSSPKHKKKNFRLLRHYLKFIVYPDQHSLKAGWLRKIVIALKLYLISFSIYVIFLLILNPLLKLADMTLPANLNIIQGDNISRLDMLLFAILMPPMVGFVEEFACRLPLTSFNKKYIDISFSLLLAIFIGRIFSDVIPVYLGSDAGPTERFLVSYAFVASFAAVIYVSLSKTTVHTRFLANNWKRSFKRLFYASAFIFSLLHIPNYLWEREDFLLLPLVLFPYFNYAMLFSLVRVRLGMAYAIGIHALIDLMAILMFVSKM
jgi:hypothetical protein